MLILLTFLELLRSHLQRIVHWMCVPHRLHYRSKHVAPTDKHNHRHSPQKPEWLKADELLARGFDLDGTAGDDDRMRR